MIGVVGNSEEKHTLIENIALFRVISNNMEHFSAVWATTWKNASQYP
jgi:hypothetical protein